MNVWYSKNNGMGIPTKHRILYFLLYMNGLPSSQYVQDVRHMDVYRHTQTHLVYNVCVWCVYVWCVCCMGVCVCCMRGVCVVCVVCMW